MKNLSFCMFACILLSCSGKNKVPSGIIQPRQMQGIMWDVIRAQALSQAMASKDSSMNEQAQTKVFTQKIFEIHKITAATFDASYLWYTAHPEVMHTLFDSLNAQSQRQIDAKFKGPPVNPFKKNILKKLKADGKNLRPS
jgi:Domain of unknown function (DUF4296)